MNIRIIAMAAIMAAGTMPASAIAQSSSTEIAKTDTSCPAGFKSSGSKCKSTSGAVAIAKVGSSCPATFKSSNGYCVSTKSGAYAEIKRGSCSGGLKTSQGKYCIK